jgi:hypothetical protein
MRTAFLVYFLGWAMAQAGFQSPSGNIHCAIYDGELRCDILNHTYKPPAKPASCLFDWGGTVVMKSKGPAQLACVSDTVADPKLPLLGYGRTWRGAGFVCVSGQGGIKCTNRDGNGWELSRTKLKLF